MIAKMRTNSKQGTASQSVADTSVSAVENSSRLFHITNVVPQHLLNEMHQVDWFSRPNEHDPLLPQRYRLTQHNHVQLLVDQIVTDLVPSINVVADTSYSHAVSTWHLSLPGSRCPLHTDGQKPNVMILYWHTPGPEYGTTFYHSCDEKDIWWTCSGIANTGFFANYSRLRRLGRPWQSMWHASPNPVPEGTYRLTTQYELHK